jgi:FSR family fosmidomycin resistance protein-like MFS transporter
LQDAVVNKPVIVTEETLIAPVVVPELAAAPAAAGPAYVVLAGISLSHFLNDTMQSLIPSVYPVLKDNYALTFAQIGLITLTFQITASLLQPVVGHFTDKKPLPFSLAIGMGFTFFGLLLFSVAHVYAMILVAGALVGLGSAVFHPESARIARLASGGRYGLAQSVFQVGGNTGSALGPVLAALIVVPFGQPSIAWFSIMAFAAIVLLWQIGRWYKPRIMPRSTKTAARHPGALSPRRVGFAIAILIMLVFSKFIYLSSLTSYYTFYLIDKFGVSTQTAQLYLFVFLASNAAGTLFGGPIGDRIGRRYVIWSSISSAPYCRRSGCSQFFCRRCQKPRAERTLSRLPCDARPFTPRVGVGRCKESIKYCRIGFSRAIHHKLSTLIVRVKCRLRNRWHCSSVSF